MQSGGAGAATDDNRMDPGGTRHLLWYTLDQAGGPEVLVRGIHMRFLVRLSLYRRFDVKFAPRSVVSELVTDNLHVLHFHVHIVVCMAK